MSVRLPSRYEDLDPTFRSRLRPVPELNSLVNQAFAGMKVSGGIRFLPVYGKSGCGKTCAACELGTHIPDSRVAVLSGDDLELAQNDLTSRLSERINLLSPQELFIWVVDQYEEKVPAKAAIPAQFVERLSLLDRGALRGQPMLFIWLTTSQEFQRALVEATSRNERILLKPAFELVSVPRAEWASVIEETFTFHNPGNELANYGVLRRKLDDVCRRVETIGRAIEEVGHEIGKPLYELQDISEYHVLMVWPVVDGTGIERVTRFTDPLSGYRLSWNAWCNQLNETDRKQLPLDAYNQARLYFDLRLVPLPVADLHGLCQRLDDESHVPLGPLTQFKNTHLYTVLTGRTDERRFGTLREHRESKRAKEAREWYKTITSQSVAVGRRLAKCLTELALPSTAEKEVRSTHRRIVADIHTERHEQPQRFVLTELKLLSSHETTPSRIRDEIRSTLKKYAQFAGFIQRQ